MPDYFEMNPDVTQQDFIDLPNNVSDQCWERLAKVGLANHIYCNETGERNTFRSTLGFFHPKRWGPAIRHG